VSRAPAAPEPAVQARTALAAASVDAELPDPHTRHLAQSYFPALDGLRAVAIAAVLWHHSLPAVADGWVARGHVGVRLFFALSGFLISSRLLAERRATGSIALGHFWLRRSLRIFPLYYAVLTLFALYLGLRAPDAGSRHFFDNLVFHATYTSNWFIDYAVSHPVWFAFGWSLACEEQFYAWWPPVLRRSSRGTAALLVLLGVFAVQQLVQYRVLGHWLASYPTVERMLGSLAPALSLGALLALCLERRSGFVLLWLPFGKYASAGAAALVLGIGVLIGHDGAPPLALDLAFAALVGSVVLAPTTWLGRLLSRAPLRSLGRVSYGVYLFHVPVLGLVRRLLPSLALRPELLFPLALALSWALAALSFRFLEAPLIALGRRPPLRPVNASLQFQ
jgi:peptidoglycan/LPS O-acetylase OafA/YrhL